MDRYDCLYAITFCFTVFICDAVSLMNIKLSVYTVLGSFVWGPDY